MLGNNRADATGVLTISSGTATLIAGSTTATDIRNFVAMGRDGGNGIVNLDGERSRRAAGSCAMATPVARPAPARRTSTSMAACSSAADQITGNGWFETSTTGDYQIVTTNVKMAARSSTRTLQREYQHGARSRGQQRHRWRPRQEWRGHIDLAARIPSPQCRRDCGHAVVGDECVAR